MFAGALAGGLNLLGGIFQQDSAAKQVQQQEQFQAGMSSTAYQRAAADAKAAGINPILVPALGGGESTPPGAMFQAENVVGQAGSSAVGAYQAKNQADLLDAQVDQVKAQTDLTEAQQEQVEAQTGLTKGSSASVGFGNVEAGIKAGLQKRHPSITKAGLLMDLLLGPLLHGGSAAASAASKFVK